jgi:hypothetical protein
MKTVEDFKKELRLDRLLILDLRLWKEARAGLRELYIGTLVINPEYKKIMGIFFFLKKKIYSLIYLVFFLITIQHLFAFRYPFCSQLR